MKNFIKLHCYNKNEESIRYVNPDYIAEIADIKEQYKNTDLQDYNSIICYSGNSIIARETVQQIFNLMHISWTELQLSTT